MCGVSGLACTCTHPRVDALCSQLLLLALCACVQASSTTRLHQQLASLRMEEMIWTTEQPGASRAGLRGHLLGWAGAPKRSGLCSMHSVAHSTGLRVAITVKRSLA